jgi:hypothetical protein
MAPDALAEDPLLVASEVLRLSGGTLAYAGAGAYALDFEAGARFVITLPQWRRAPASQEQ